MSSYDELESDERTLQDMIREKDALESRPHDGFADATRVMQLASRIGDLEEQIRRRKQQAAMTEG